jgi:two-component system sensor kinase FixL
MTSRPITAEILHEALRQAPGVIMITDAEMNIIYVNRVEMGYKPEDVIGRRHGSFVSAEQRRKLELVFERARATGEAQHYETSLDAPDGERHYYSNQISAYETEAGSGMITIFTEVTRHRAAEVRIEGLRQELLQASHRAGMAEIATGVLHNVGNVLNSVNVSAESLMKELESSRLHLLGRTTAMLEENEARLAEFLTEDPKGRKLPALLGKLGQELAAERERLHTELSRLRKHIGLMRSIVEAQQSLAKLGDMTEPVRPDELIHQTLTMFQLDIESRVIDLRLELADLGTVLLDKQATLQVLANLVRNAIEALEAVERSRRLVIRLHADDHKLYFDVEDNGSGIHQEHLEKLFQHGFSTKPNGHGFGLHTSAIAARTMNGTLEAHSDGPGEGARIRFTLPRIVP